MVNRKRKFRRAKSNARNTSRLDRLRSGVPVTLRNGSKDPRQLPISFEWSVVVRYIVQYASGTDVQVVSARSPDEFPRIFVPVGSSTVRQSAPLTYQRIIQDAWMRHYGYRMPFDTVSTEYNWVNTQFAIGKVTMFGPLGSFDHIVLQVQYCGEAVSDSHQLPDTHIPSFVGQDSGNRLSRAKVSCTPPRLIWSRARTDPNADSNIVVIPSWESMGVSSFDAGVVDVTVHIRRGFGRTNASTFSNVKYLTAEEGTKVLLHKHK